MSLSSAVHLSLEGKPLLRLELEGAVLWKGLPPGYTPLDHIEATGSQYIDTGFVPDQDSRIQCEFLWLGGNGVYGARNTVSTRNFSMRVIADKWQLGFGDGVSSGTIEADNGWHIADQNKNTLYIDGELAAEREYAEFSAPYPIAIGGIRAGSMYYGQGKYRGCRIWDNGSLVRDLIPCLDPEGTAGMLDTLSGVFYGSAGADPFVAGTGTE